MYLSLVLYLINQLLANSFCPRLYQKMLRKSCYIKNNILGVVQYPRGQDKGGGWGLINVHDVHLDIEKDEKKSRFFHPRGGGGKKWSKSCARGY